MANGGKSSHVADHCMVGGEGLATVAEPGSVGESPPIAQTKGIPELTLV